MQNKNLNLDKKTKDSSPFHLMSITNRFFSEKVNNLLFIQKRAGKDGKLFDIFKIRTMKEGTDNNMPKEVLDGNKKADDDRIIPERKWMRRTWFDEIPQLINIIQWDMNFFWARPISENLLSQLTKSQIERRNKYKPWIFWGYAFLDKWKDSKKRTLRQAQDIYLRMRYKKEKQGIFSKITFNMWVFQEDIKALFKGRNK